MRTNHTPYGDEVSERLQRAVAQLNSAAAIATLLGGITATAPMGVACSEAVVSAAPAAGVKASPAAAKASVATGRLHLTFTERSPLSKQEEVLRRIDATLWTIKQAEEDRTDLEYDLADESFEVFVPPAYKGDVPYGLFVWTGVTEVPPAWNPIFSRHRLIWISANITKGRKGFLRVQLPLDAVHNMKKAYNIDENRVYAGGFSAGGGLATHMVCSFPDVFRGGYFLMGGHFYRTYRNENGRWETTVDRLTPQWKGPIDQIKRSMRLVLMRGETDTVYRPREDRGQYESLLLDGFTRVTYIEVPRLGHHLPNALWFEKGIVALDQSQPRVPPTTSPTTQPHPLPSQVAQAQRLLATAQMLLDSRNQISARRRDQAHAYLQRILEDYPTTPAAAQARQLLDGK